MVGGTLVAARRHSIFVVFYIVLGSPSTPTSPKMPMTLGQEGGKKQNNMKGNPGITKDKC